MFPGEEKGGERNNRSQTEERTEEGKTGFGCTSVEVPRKPPDQTGRRDKNKGTTQVGGCLRW